MKICISASIRFKSKIIEISNQLDELGVDYLLPVMDLPKEKEAEEMTSSLVYEHFKKIDQVDTLLVVNPGGYIGNSVKIEIGYAKGKGKEIFFLEKTDLLELDCLADEFVGVLRVGRVFEKIITNVA